MGDPGGLYIHPKRSVLFPRFTIRAVASISFLTKVKVKMYNFTSKILDGLGSSKP